MIRSRKHPAGESPKQRRREIVNCLAGFGLAKRGLSGSQGVDPDSEAEAHAQRLAVALQTLGPVFASFGLYLSSRPDLIALSECVNLARIVNHGTPTPPDAVRQIIQSELDVHAANVPGQARFVKFEPEAFESRLLFQLHYGELDNGDQVVVKIVHPAIDLEQELELLSVAATAVTPLLCDADQIGRAIEDFRLVVADSLDCRRTAETLETLAHETRDDETLRVPRVYRELCSRNILVTQRLEGVRLDRYLEKCSKQSTSTRESARCVDGVVPDELARLLCDTWLRQAFETGLLPVDLRPENILVRSSTEIAIVDGTIAHLPAASKRNILDYLIATANDEPGSALDQLLHELDGSERTLSPANLDRKFRQVVAFREGGWEDGGRANCLSDTLFAQWRLAATHGYRPLRHLIQVYRGTFHIAALARQLTPQRDSLLEGIKDLRLSKLLQDVGTMIEPSYWASQLDRVVTLMVLGPRHLDDALKSVSDKEKLQNERRHAKASSAASWNPLLAALLALACFALFRQPASATLSAEWSERLSAVLFIAVGGLVIRLLAASSEP